MEQTRFRRLFWLYVGMDLLDEQSPVFPRVLYFAASNLLFVGGGRWAHLSNSKSYYMWFSILTLIAITAMNVVGLNIGKWLHNIGSFGMWVPVLILVVIGIYAWKSFGSATSFTLEISCPVHI